MNNPIKSITKLASKSGQQLRGVAEGASKYALKRAEALVIDEPPFDESPTDSTEPEEAQKASTETRPEPEKPEEPVEQNSQNEPQDTLDAAFEHARESFENGRDRNPEEISAGVFNSLKDELKTGENEHQDQNEREHRFEDEDQVEDDEVEVEDQHELEHQQPVRQFRAIFSEDDGRHEDTRYLTVSPGAWNGKPSRSEPDVLLDIPHLSVEKISLEVENLRAQVSLHAEVNNLVSIDVGANVEIEEVELEIEGVNAQALLKVRLDEVHGILDRALGTLDNHPEFITRTLITAEDATEDVTSTASDVVDSASEALSGTAKSVAEKAKSWVGSSDDDSGPSIEASSHTRYEDS